MFENGEVFYRAIPQNQLDDLIKTGKIQAGTETFTSPTLEYIKQKGYEGVIIKFHMEKYKNYLIDNITLIIEEIELLKNNKEDEFVKGQRTAYYSVITIFKEQAKLFDIDLKEIKLDLLNEADIL